MSDIKMMKCGHSSNGQQILSNGDKIPCCCICDCTEIVDTPNLSERKARCRCGKLVESSTNLAFFKQQSDKDYDSFYCGCRGWG